MKSTVKSKRRYYQRGMNNVVRGLEAVAEAFAALQPRESSRKVAANDN